MYTNIDSSVLRQVGLPTLKRPLRPPFYFLCEAGSGNNGVIKG